jgi:uncharacterized protein (TIGR02145 family)
MTKQTHIRVGGSWKKVNNVYQRVAGEWKEKAIPHVNVNGVWKECMSYQYPISLVKYGKLYRWGYINFSKPFITDMHIPSRDEMVILFNYIDTHYNTPPTDFGPGNHLKHRRQSGSPLGSPWDTTIHPYWAADTVEYGRDTLNFGAFPAGYGYYAYRRTLAYNFLSSAFFWTSYHDGSEPHYYAFSSSGSHMHIASTTSYWYFSLRLIRDATAAEQLVDDGTIVAKVSDFDENIYDCVKIGTQVFTVQNLNTTKYADGSSITNINPNDQIDNCTFNDESESIWQNFIVGQKPI